MQAAAEQLQTQATPDAGADATAQTTAQRRIDELGRIILAYSEITERLQKSHEQLTGTVQKLRTELGEKDRLLERRNRLAALGEMAAGMAHEIRNPLGGIQLYASMLAKDVAGMPESRRLVDKISGGVRRLEDIVSKVLHFSRDLRAAPTEGDVAAMLAEAADLASAKATERSVTLTLDGPDTLPARFDRLLMSQAVLNLLLNAVEVTPPGQSVTVSYARDGDRTTVRIRDRGTGVPNELLDKIFNPFFTTKDEGTGLGLSIVHRVIEAHDGAVTVRNDPEGGAVFEVRW